MGSRPRPVSREADRARRDPAERRGRPGQDRDGRRGVRLALGIAAGRARPAGPRGDAAAVARGRPAGARAAARPAPPGGDDASRSRAGATRSRARCSTRCRTTCARRSRASGRRRGTWPIPRWACRPTAVREAAETIDAEAQRLDRLVTSVLDLSRIESGRAPARSRGVRPPRARGDGRRRGFATQHRRPPGLDRAAGRPAARPGRRGPARCRAGEPPRERRATHTAGHALTIRAARGRSGSDQPCASRTTGPAWPTRTCRACSTSSIASAGPLTAPVTGWASACRWCAG